MQYGLVGLQAPHSWDLIQESLLSRRPWWMINCSDSATHGSEEETEALSYIANNRFHFIWSDALHIQTPNGLVDVFSLLPSPILPRASFHTRSDEAQSLHHFIGSYQILNHLPGNAHLCSKAMLVKSIHAAISTDPRIHPNHSGNGKNSTNMPHVFDICPATFYVPGALSKPQNEQTPGWIQFTKQYHEVKQGKYSSSHVPVKHCSRNLWMVKPVHGRDGTGIHIFDDIGLIKRYLQTVTGDWIIQKVIERPLCISGHKISMRMWMLVTDTFDTYLHREPHFFVSMENYAPLSERHIEQNNIRFPEDALARRTHLASCSFSESSIDLSDPVYQSIQTQYPGRILYLADIEEELLERWNRQHEWLEKEERNPSKTSPYTPNRTNQVQYKHVRFDLPENPYISAVPNSFQPVTLASNQSTTYKDSNFNTPPALKQKQPPGLTEPREFLEKALLPRVRRVLADAIRGASSSLRCNIRGRRCFEIYSADFVIDEDLRPWLIDIAENPSFDAPTETHETLVTGMLAQALCLSVDPLFTQKIEPRKAAQRRTSEDSPTWMHQHYLFPSSMESTVVPAVALTSGGSVSPTKDEDYFYSGTSNSAAQSKSSLSPGKQRAIHHTDLSFNAIKYRKQKHSVSTELETLQNITPNTMASSVRLTVGTDTEKVNIMTRNSSVYQKRLISHVQERATGFDALRNFGRDRLARLAQTSTRYGHAATVATSPQQTHIYAPPNSVTNAAYTQEWPSASIERESAASDSPFVTTELHHLKSESLFDLILRVGQSDMMDQEIDSSLPVTDDRLPPRARASVPSWAVAHGTASQDDSFDYDTTGNIKNKFPIKTRETNWWDALQGLALDETIELSPRMVLRKPAISPRRYPLTPRSRTVPYSMEHTSSSSTLISFDESQHTVDTSLRTVSPTVKRMNDHAATNNENNSPFSTENMNNSFNNTAEWHRDRQNKPSGYQKTVIRVPAPPPLPHTPPLSSAPTNVSPQSQNNLNQDMNNDIIVDYLDTSQQSVDQASIAQHGDSAIKITLSQKRAMKRHFATDTRSSRTANNQRSSKKMVEKHTGKRTDKKTDRHMGKQTEKKTGRHMGKQTDKQAYGHTSERTKTKARSTEHDTLQPPKPTIVQNDANNNAHTTMKQKLKTQNVQATCVTPDTADVTYKQKNEIMRYSAVLLRAQGLLKTVNTAIKRIEQSNKSIPQDQKQYVDSLHQAINQLIFSLRNETASKPHTSRNHSSISAKSAALSLAKMLQDLSDNPYWLKLLKYGKENHENRKSLQHTSNGNENASPKQKDRQDTLITSSHSPPRQIVGSDTTITSSHSPPRQTVGSDTTTNSSHSPPRQKETINPSHSPPRQKTIKPKPTSNTNSPNKKSQSSPSDTKRKTRLKTLTQSVDGLKQSDKANSPKWSIRANRSPGHTFSNENSHQSNANTNQHGNHAVKSPDDNSIQSIPILSNSQADTFTIPDRLDKLWVMVTLPSDQQNEISRQYYYNAVTRDTTWSEPDLTHGAVIIHQEQLSQFMEYIHQKDTSLTNTSTDSKSTIEHNLNTNDRSPFHMSTPQAKNDDLHFQNSFTRSKTSLLDTLSNQISDVDSTLQDWARARAHVVGDSSWVINHTSSLSPSNHIYSFDAKDMYDRASTQLRDYKGKSSAAKSSSRIVTPVTQQPSITSEARAYYLSLRKMNDARVAAFI